MSNSDPALRNITDEILTVWDLFLADEAAERFKSMLDGLQDVRNKAPDLEDTDNVKVLLDQIYKGQILTQIARTQGLKAEYEVAHRTLDEAKDILKGIKDIPTDNKSVMCELAALKARIELERGRAVNSSGDPASSVQFFQEAFDAASTSIEVEETADREFEGMLPSESCTQTLQYLAVDTLHMLAIVHSSKEQRDEYARKGLRIAEHGKTSTHVRRWLGPLLNNIAWDALESGNLPESISLFQRAEEVRKSELDALELGATGNVKSEAENTVIKDKRTAAWKIARWSVGHAQMAAGKEADAIETFTEILNDGLDGPFIRADLASLVAKQGDSNAVEYANRAITLGVSKERVPEMLTIIDKFST